MTDLKTLNLHLQANLHRKQNKDIQQTERERKRKEKKRSK